MTASYVNRVTALFNEDKGALNKITFQGRSIADLVKAALASSASEEGFSSLTPEMQDALAGFAAQLQSQSTDSPFKLVRAEGSTGIIIGVVAAAAVIGGIIIIADDNNPTSP
jgi:hypothetical protein